MGYAGACGFEENGSGDNYGREGNGSYEMSGFYEENGSDVGNDSDEENGSYDAFYDDESHVDAEKDFDGAFVGDLKAEAEGARPSRKVLLDCLLLIQDFFEVEALEEHWIPLSQLRAKRYIIKLV